MASKRMTKAKCSEKEKLKYSGFLSLLKDAFINKDYQDKTIGLKAKKEIFTRYYFEAIEYSSEGRLVFNCMIFFGLSPKIAKRIDDDFQCWAKKAIEYADCVDDCYKQDSRETILYQHLLTVEIAKSEMEQAENVFIETFEENCP